MQLMRRNYYRGGLEDYFFNAIIYAERYRGNIDLVLARWLIPLRLCFLSDLNPNVQTLQTHIQEC